MRATLRCVLTLSIGSGACDSAPAPEAAAPAPKAAPADAGPRSISTMEQLSIVCNGEAVAPAAAFETKPGVVSPVAYLYKDLTFPADATEFRLSRPAELTPWSVRKPAEVQLVACVTVTEANRVRECPFNTGAVLELYSTVATVAIFEASTGKKIGEKTVTDDASGRGCPSTALMRADRQRDYGLLTTEVTRVIATHQPADVPRPAVAAWHFADACAGKPALGAGKLATGPDAVNPFAVFLREGTEPFRYGDVVRYSLDQGWFQRNLDARSGTSDPAVSLAVCMTSTRGKKLRDCPFSGGAKLAVFSAQWEVDLVAAATGEKLASKSFPGANKCPEVWDFAYGAELTSEPGPALVEWIAPHAGPR